MLNYVKHVSNSFRLLCSGPTGLKFAVQEASKLLATASSKARQVDGAPCHVSPCIFIHNLHAFFTHFHTLSRMVMHFHTLPRMVMHFHAWSRMFTHLHAWSGIFLAFQISCMHACMIGFSISCMHACMKMQIVGIQKKNACCMRHAWNACRKNVNNSKVKSMAFN